MPQRLPERRFPVQGEALEGEALEEASFAPPATQAVLSRRGSRRSGGPQESIPLPPTSLRVIPGFGKAIPDPVAAELILVNLQMFGTLCQGAATSLAVVGPENDPIYNLPVTKVLGALHAHGGCNPYWTDTHVLANQLKK